VHADRYFEIGSTHTVCEDYALAGTDGGLSWAIVSDGCSSSINTDVGARLLSHIAKESLQYLHGMGKLFDQAFLANEFPMFLRHYIIARALEVKSAMRLDYEAFDATLLVAFASVPENARGSWGVIAFGDGSVVLKAEDKIRRVRMHYDSNAPYYLSYGMSKDKNDMYHQAFGVDKSLNVLHDLDWMPSDMESKDPCSPWSFKAFGQLDGDNVPEQVILFSDGVDSYESKDRSVPFNSDTATQSLIGYKSIAGEFVQRRMKAYRKECDKSGISHYDDVSCAAISLVE